MPARVCFNFKSKGDNENGALRYDALDRSNRRICGALRIRSLRAKFFGYGIGGIVLDHEKRTRNYFRGSDRGDPRRSGSGFAFRLFHSRRWRSNNQLASITLAVDIKF